jgi:hypothetical protein
MTKVQLKDDVYNRDIWLVYGFTDKQGTAFLQEYTDAEEWDPHFDDACWVQSANGKAHFIMVKKRGTDSSTLALLAHECLHLTFAVLDEAGFTYCEESEEAYTYFLQNIFFQCVEIFKKRKVKK